MSDNTALLTKAADEFCSNKCPSLFTSADQPRHCAECVAVREAIGALASAASDLAEAAMAYDEAIQSCANEPERMASFCSAQGDDLDSLYARFVMLARAVLANQS